MCVLCASHLAAKSWQGRSICIMARQDLSTGLVRAFLKKGLVNQPDPGESDDSRFQSTVSVSLRVMNGEIKYVK